MTYIIQVLVPTPAHSNLRGPLSYTFEHHLPAGTIVKVPLGKREVLGVVCETPEPLASEQVPHPALEQEQAPAQVHDFKYKEIISFTQGLLPLGQDWLELVEFTAQYYQRAMGEVAVAALPSQLKSLTGEQIQKKLNKWQTQQTQKIKAASTPGEKETELTERTLSKEQERALQTIHNNAEAFPFIRCHRQWKN
jgi:primosomal protein N' (replication factor Y)